MDAQTTGATVEVDVLGPPRLVVAGRAVDVPGTRRRAVLALLALAEGDVVTVEHLLDVLWAPDRPASGRAAVHNHVSRLRTHLGPAARQLQTLDGAYRLGLADAALDARRARRTWQQARGLVDPHEAAVLLEGVLGLWRGPALAGLCDVPAVAAAAVGLERLRWRVIDELARCWMGIGDLDGATTLAAGAVAADPLAEPPVRLLVRTLAAAGRTHTALRTARDYRHRLTAQTGLTATAALADLERVVAGGRPAEPVPRPCPWCGARAAPDGAPAGELSAPEPAPGSSRERSPSRWATG